MQPTIKIKGLLLHTTKIKAFVCQNNLGTIQAVFTMMAQSKGEIKIHNTVVYPRCYSSEKLKK